VVNTAFEVRRLEYDVGIGYGDDIERAKALILEALRAETERGGVALRAGSECRTSSPTCRLLRSGGLFDAWING
jgi:hypothetical protein